MCSANAPPRPRNAWLLQDASLSGSSAGAVQAPIQVATASHVSGFVLSSISSINFSMKSSVRRGGSIEPLGCGDWDVPLDNLIPLGFYFLSRHEKLS